MNMSIAITSVSLPRSIKAVFLHLLAILVLAIIIVYRFREVIFGGLHFMYPGDTTDLTYSLYVFVARSIKSGVFPLWNPNSFNGYPLVAYPQISLFYPLNILFWIIPYKEGPFPYYAYQFLVLFHVVFSGYAFFVLGRLLKLSFISALLGGILYMSSPNILIFLGWGYQIIAFPWYPLLLGFLWISRGQIKPYYAIVAGLCLGMLIIASPAQPAILALFLIVFIGSLDTLSGIIVSKTTIPTIISIKNYILILLLGILIGSITLLPLIEFMPQSIRFLGVDGHVSGNQKIPKESLISHRMQPKSLLGIVTPTLSHTPVSNSFFGATVIVLALFAIFEKGRRKLVMIMYVLITFSIICALGIYFPERFYSVPFLNMVREPDKYLFYVTIALSLCAAIGFDFVFRLARGSKLMVVLVIVLTLVFSILALVYLTHGFDTKGIYLGLFIIGILSIMLATFKIPHSLLSKYCRAFLLMVMFVVVIADITTYQPNLLSSKTFNIMNYLSSQEKLSKIIPKFPKIYRIAAVENAQGWPYAFTGGDLVGYYDNFGYGNPLYYKMMQFRSSNNYCGIYYDLMNTKYFVSNTEGNKVLDTCGNTVEKVAQINDVYHVDYSKQPQNQLGDLAIYENKNRLGYAWFTTDILPPEAHQREQILENVNIRDQALTTDYGSYQELKTRVGRLNEDPVRRMGVSNFEYKVEDYSPNRISIPINSPAQGLLVLSEIYYPGWEATVDGASTKVYEVDHMLRSVMTSSGVHHITISFHPRSLYIATTIAAITLISVLIFTLRGAKIVDNVWLYSVLFSLIFYFLYLYISYSSFNLFITI